MLRLNKYKMINFCLLHETASLSYSIESVRVPNVLRKMLTNDFMEQERPRPCRIQTDTLISASRGLIQKNAESSEIKLSGSMTFRDLRFLRKLCQMITVLLQSNLKTQFCKLGKCLRNYTRQAPAHHLFAIADPSLAQSNGTNEVITVHLVANFDNFANTGHLLVI